MSSNVRTFPNFPQNSGNRKGPISTGKDFMTTFTAPDYVIDGIVQRGRLYACTSITGHGKTAIWLHTSCMVTHGRMLGTLEVTQGNVLILAGENPEDLCGRMHAEHHAFNLNLDKMPHVLPKRFPLTEAEAGSLKNDIDALGIEPVMIVVDTGPAYFPGDDDNKNVPMGDFGRTLRILTTCKGSPAVIVNTHPVKNADSPDDLIPRGGGALLNELDANLTIWSDALGESATLHWLGKLRGANFEPVHFILRPVPMDHLRDRRGRPFVSIVAELQSQDAADNARGQAFTNENAILYWLNERPGISIAAIARAAGWVNDADQPIKSKVQRALDKLNNDKLVKLFRNKWIITDAGKKELNKHHQFVSPGNGADPAEQQIGTA